MDEDYVEAVLGVVRLIPPGRVMTYGLIAEVVMDQDARRGRPVRGGPRQVGRAMAASGGDVPWWRVVNASGRPPGHHLETALEHLAEEDTPMVAAGDRVAVGAAVWWPEDE